MAAITPTTVDRQNFGSANLFVAKFSTVSTGDTWASGITTTPAYWFGQLTTVQSTQTSGGINIAFSGGTFTFNPSEDGKALTLIVSVK